MNLFFWRKPKPKKLIRLHDYTAPYRGWGHNFDVIGETKKGFLISGWGYGLKEGDHFKYTTHDYREVIYKIKKIEYYRDPPDMWNAELVKLGGNE